MYQYGLSGGVAGQVIGTSKLHNFGLDAKQSLRSGHKRTLKKALFNFFLQFYFSGDIKLQTPEAEV